MTFASEEVRQAYHELPTETQLSYERVEWRFAELLGQSLHVDEIIRTENSLEVVIRIRAQFNSMTGS